jgi:hypothetical protein
MSTKRRRGGTTGSRERETEIERKETAGYSGYNATPGI